MRHSRFYDIDSFFFETIHAVRYRFYALFSRFYGFFCGFLDIVAYLVQNGFNSRQNALCGKGNNISMIGCSALVTFSEFGDGVISANMSFVINGDKDNIFRRVFEITEGLGENSIKMALVK